MATQKRGTVSAKTIRWIWLICFAPVVLVVVMMTLAATGAFGRMPSFEELENPKSNLATEIYSEDGKVLSTFFIQNRSFLTFLYWFIFFQIGQNFTPPI